MDRIFATSLLIALLLAGAAGIKNGDNARAQAEPAATSAALDLFYMGNRSSRLESCGCHSRQQGGVQYESVIYGQHAANAAVRVDLGNWVTFGINTRPVELMVTRYLMRAFTMLGMDAVNMGLRDIELTADFIKAYDEKYPGQMPPLVSANIFSKEHPAKPAFAPYRIVEKKMGEGSTVKLGITGVAWLNDEEHSLPRDGSRPAQHETISYVARSPKECLKSVIEALRPQVDLLLVLSSGDVGSASEIAAAFPQVDVVIARNALDAPAVESSHVGNVRLLFSRNSQGKELGLTTLVRGADKSWQFKSRPEYLPVSKELDPDPKFIALIEEFKRETRTLKPKLPPEDVKEIYAGAQRCQMCHDKIYASWKKTRHGQAIATLINKGQQFNPLCLKCHVTGFQEANGFYAIDHPGSQRMVDVQCEVCHGPGLAHAEAEALKIAGGQNFMTPAEFKKKMDEGQAGKPRKHVPESVCLKCHTPENDDHFVYQEKLPKVKH